MRTIGLVLFLISLTSCSTTEPPDDPEPVLKLELEDVSCTEAWINLTTANLPPPTTLNLLENSNVTKTINLQTADTLLYIDSLLPNQTYKFQVSSIQSTAGGLLSSIQYQVSSNELSVTTMDTTSHNFTWQTWTFGENSSSVLYDVAIVNENCIWAVGEIYMLDSLGNPDPHAYNAVHWDGQKWELKKIYTYSTCSAVDYAPLKSIWAFSDTSIVVTTGAGVWWFDGSTFKPDCSIRPLLTGVINKLWGSSSSDLYAVGNAGNIAYWDGSKWTKIESGTTLDFQDIWGSINNKTNDLEIISIASNIYTNEGKEVIKISNGATEKLPTNGLSAYFEGIWFKPERKYFIVGGGIHTKRLITDTTNWYRYPAGYINYHYSTSVRGNEINDIIIGGSSGEMVHFNGVSWKNYLNEITLTNGGLLGITIKENKIATVGFDGGRAVIIVGIRN